MSSHRKLNLALKAHVDMADIAQYTKGEWGAEQWRAYSRAMAAGFNRIAIFPELGEARPELGEGIRSMLIEYHVVYYRATPKTIRVLRIRHIRNHPLTASDL